MTYYPRTVRQVPDYYFVSRVSQIQKYEDKKNLGDRNLAIFLGRDHWLFSTYDVETKNPDVNTKVPISHNFQSRWHYIYYSFNQKVGKAVAFVKHFDDDKVPRVEFKVTHLEVDFLWFRFGGAEFTYPGFNGQFANIVFGYGKPRYIETVADFLIFFGRYRVPLPSINTRSVVQIVTQETRFSYTDTKVSTFSWTKPLLEQYAVLGWIRQIYFPRTKSYYLIFRLSENIENNQQIDFGDHAISLFINQQGSYQSGTYTLPSDKLKLFPLEKTSEN